MKIGFVSYEYIPQTGFGGIATYVWHAARMLAAAGHHVEVVCGSLGETSTSTEDGVIVHRTAGEARFHDLAANVMSARHVAIGGFDVVEGPDANAEAAEFMNRHPDVAIVTKLHTPLYIVDRYHESNFNFVSGTRFILGALRRGRLPKWPIRRRDHLEFERVVTLQSDMIAAPTQAIAHLVGQDWSIPQDRLTTFPLPFESPEDLLHVPILPDRPTQTILFVGRLEPRKGVQHVVEAARILRRTHPNVKLRCIGRKMGSNTVGVSMEAHLRKLAGSRSAQWLEMPGAQPRERLAGELASADVCVFPSLWENFPYVCLEAMTAGRCIVGSSAGGMSEMLADGAGVCQPPARPDLWAEAIRALLDDPERRGALGEAARRRVLSEYSYAQILPNQVAAYEQAIARAKMRKGRPLFERPPP